MEYANLVKSALSSFEKFKAEHMNFNEKTFYDLGVLEGMIQKAENFLGSSKPNPSGGALAIEPLSPKVVAPRSPNDLKANQAVQKVIIRHGIPVWSVNPGTRILQSIKSFANGFQVNHRLMPSLNSEALNYFFSVKFSDISLNSIMASHAGEDPYIYFETKSRSILSRLNEEIPSYTNRLVIYYERQEDVDQDLKILEELIFKSQAPAPVAK